MSTIVEESTTIVSSSTPIYSDDSAIVEQSIVVCSGNWKAYDNCSSSSSLESLRDLYTQLSINLNNVESTLTTAVETIEAFTYTKSDVDGILAALEIALTASYKGYTDGEITAYNSNIVLTYETKANATSTAASITAALESYADAAVGNLGSTIGVTYETKADANATEASITTALQSYADTAVGVLGSTISSVYETKANASSSSAALTTALQSYADTAVGNYSATAATTYATSVDLASADSSIRTDLSSQITTAVGVVSADLSTNYYTSVQADSAIAAAETTLRSELEDGDAVINELLLTEVSGDPLTAKAVRLDTMEVSIADTTVSIEGLDEINMTQVTKTNSVDLSPPATPVEGDLWEVDDVFYPAPNDTVKMMRRYENTGTILLPVYEWIDLTYKQKTMVNLAYWTANSSKLLTAPDGSVTGWEFGDGTVGDSQFTIKADNFRISNGDIGNTASDPIFSVDTIGGVVSINGTLVIGNLTQSDGNPANINKYVGQYVDHATATANAVDLSDGDTYYNTTDEILYEYINGAWVTSAPYAQFFAIVFKRSATTPATPSGGTYESSVPAGWSDGIPAADPAKDAQDPVWWSAFTFDTITDYVTNPPAWSAPAIAADTETQDLMYNDSLTLPATPTYSGDLTSAQLEDTANGWYNNATTSSVYAAYRVKSQGSWTAWTVYKIKGEDGANGTDVNIVFNAHSSNTVAPSIVGTSALPSGWDDGIGDTANSTTNSSVSYLWYAKGTGVDGVWTWGTPKLNTNTHAAELKLFKLNDTAIATAGSYNFATGTLSGQEAGWTQEVPALTGDGDAVYVTSAVVTGAHDSVVTPSWSTPVVYSTRVDGLAGVSGAGVGTAYKRSVVKPSDITDTDSTPTGWDLSLGASINSQLLFTTAESALYETSSYISNGYTVNTIYSPPNANGEFYVNSGTIDNITTLAAFYKDTIGGDQSSWLATITEGVVVALYSASNDYVFFKVTNKSYQDQYYEFEVEVLERSVSTLLGLGTTYSFGIYSQPSLWQSNGVKTEDSTTWAWSPTELMTDPYAFPQVGTRGNKIFSIAVKFDTLTSADPLPTITALTAISHIGIGTDVPTVDVGAASPLYTEMHTIYNLFIGTTNGVAVPDDIIRVTWYGTDNLPMGTSDIVYTENIVQHSSIFGTTDFLWDVKLYVAGDAIIEGTLSAAQLNSAINITTDGYIRANGEISGTFGSACVAGNIDASGGIGNNNIGVWGGTTQASYAGVMGINNDGTHANSCGILGSSTSGKGVRGISVSGTGVYGFSSTGFGGFFSGGVEMDTLHVSTLGTPVEFPKHLDMKDNATYDYTIRLSADDVGGDGSSTNNLYISGNAIANSLSPFTGSHYGFGLDIFIEGDIVSTESQLLINVDQSFTELTNTITTADKTVFGVVSFVRDDTLNFLMSSMYFTDATKQINLVEVEAEDADGNAIMVEKEEVTWVNIVKPEYQEYINYVSQTGYKTIRVNSLGEGGINICSINGNIDNGDYITSSTVPGKGQKQNDDLLHNYTVAKALETVDWALETIGINGCYGTLGSDGIEYKTKMIACTYHCG